MTPRSISRECLKTLPWVRSRGRTPYNMDYAYILLVSPLPSSEAWQTKKRPRVIPGSPGDNPLFLIRTISSQYGSSALDLYFTLLRPLVNRRWSLPYPTLLLVVEVIGLVPTVGDAKNAVMACNHADDALHDMSLPSANQPKLHPSALL